VLRVAIVGCGKIADAHVEQIRRVAGCEVVGVCDREPLMARQLCDRFGIRAAFSDVAELLTTCRPNVVHITTPPQSHFAVARQCLEHGSHVYVEKPLTVCAPEAEQLIRLAEQRGLKLTVGHDLQFSHVARRMREMVRGGYLGGSPVHMESYYSYDLGDTTYAQAFLGDKEHWVRKLPGGLLHNVISHGVARIAEFLTTDSTRVIAHGFVSPRLRSLGEEAIVDELRVMVCEAERLTAYFTFSSQMRPSLNQFRIFGSENGILIDEDEQTLVKLRGARFKSYAGKFVPALVLAGQYVGNVFDNARLFLARDFQMKSGMKYLIEAFYRAVADGAPLPISYREMLLTSAIMDTVFEQVAAGHSQRQPGCGTDPSSSPQIA
jgi:predicted dehydrogenase